MMVAQKQVPASGQLSPEEVSDERDVSPRAPKADTSGKRVRAIPAKGGTEVQVDRASFKRAFGIDHADVSFNFRRNNFTVKVGNGKNNTLTEEAADALTEEFPESFEYWDDGGK